MAQYPLLLDQLTAAVRQLPVSSATVRTWQDALIGELQRNRAQFVQLVLTQAERAATLFAAAALVLFLTLILLADGRRVWGWLVRLLPAASRATVDRAGTDAYTRLSAWVRGTAVIAAFHAVVVAVTLAILRVPLLAPLAVLVFLGSFVPIVGAVIFGGVAVVVAFATQGLDAALVLVAVLVVDNQIESHVLQPFLIGRYVRLHPLVVTLVITAGGVLEGLAGAILAVPLTAAVYAAFVSTASLRARPDRVLTLPRRVPPWRGPRVAHRSAGPSVPVPDERFTRPATAAALDAALDAAAVALRAHGITVEILDAVADARRRVGELVPAGAEVATATSETLRVSGIDEDLNSSGRYAPVREPVGTAPGYAVGGVHAVTEDGRVVIGSGTGSQIGVYANGAGKVIWVAGAQQVVPDLEAALRRVEASGTPSPLRKVLVVNGEVDPRRSTVLLVREPTGS